MARAAWVPVMNIAAFRSVMTWHMVREHEMREHMAIEYKVREHMAREHKERDLDLRHVGQAEQLEDHVGVGLALPDGRHHEHDLAGVVSTFLKPTAIRGSI